VASRRIILWRINAEDVLRRFARQCALDVAHLWDIPSVVREYLETGDETKRDAAGAAARVAAGAAGVAADAAARAARAAGVAAGAADWAADAAARAAGVAAGAADWAADAADWAADAAARAAGVAAGAADWAADAAARAAGVAAWDAQNERLIAMVIEARTVA
jgi:phage-related tail protein